MVVVVAAAAAAAAVVAAVVAVDFRPPRPHRLAAVAAAMVHVGGTGPEILVVVVVDVAVHTHPVRWSRSVPHCNHAVASWCVQ